MSVKRAERLFNIIGLLRSGRGFSSSELARAVGVSKRTIYRDILDLSGIVPVYFDDGYRLLSDSYLSHLAFTRDELLALKLGIEVAPLTGSSHWAGAAQSALGKIQEHIDRRYGVDTAATDSFSVHVSAYTLDDNTVRALRVLEEAVGARRTVEIKYHTMARDAVGVRAVNPYGLTFRRHSWYLVAWCHMRREERIFRLDRVLAVKMTSKRFERPADFSVEGFFANAWEVYASGKETDVRLAFERRAAQIAEPALRGRGKFEPEDGGMMIFKGRVPVSDEFVRWLLSFAGDVEVLTPASLRDAVKTNLSEAAEQYRGGNSEQ
jgi:predicted DNA-binding transcriptional regulator YafY